MPPRPRKPTAAAPYPPGWEPFLAAINADLDDDTPRLVFADWLQENGDEARGQFIRLQCTGDASADAILAEHRERWFSGLPQWCADRPDGCVFRRGFVAAMTVLGSHWLARSPFAKPRDAGGKAIRQITALEELRIEQVWNDVVTTRALAGLRRLTVTSAASGVIESLAKSPALPTLTDLAIEGKGSDGVTKRSFMELFGADKLAGLRRLRFESKSVGDLVARGLQFKWFSGLEELRLRHTSLTAGGAQELARLSAANLRVLDLLNNAIGDGGLRTLLDSPALRKLEELVLRQCHLTLASVRALANWEGLRSVRSLNLTGNGLKTGDAQIIAQSPHARDDIDITCR
jgi:uncharacterized protein (TIGR02996 family)